MGFKNHAQRKAVWASRNENKKGSPAKHCNSEMMHQGGWAKMRPINSPGTIGNKAGIKHNEKMRENIGTFKMPHATPLAATENDSIAASNAWKREKELYLKKPDGQKEYDMEKGEKYYDVVKKKLRLIPTNDAEEKDLTGIKKWQLAPNRKSSRKIPGQDLDKVEIDERGEYAVNIHNRQDTIRPADGRNFKTFIQGKQSGKMESGYLSDDDYTIKNGKISPLKKKVEKDACYNKVKAAVKVWPSAYASGQLVQCRKRGASNWGVGKKK